ncbi:MAG TPA: site-2 protease family protein, partial [Gemmatimonadaceae bacterium]|nr:site-2 protease family protein [Gemmatimonadaceae bacterium]
MLTWLAPIIVFGLVVFVHELGHFLAAKAVGVYAPRFSIGFGPALFRKRWGETEYVLAALPLGGYVRMASREDETIAELLEGGAERPAERGDGVEGGDGGDGGEPRTTGASGSPKMADERLREGMRPDEWDPEALAPFGPKPVPEHRLFESKGLLARLFILIAGVVMNFLLTLG